MEHSERPSSDDLHISPVLFFANLTIPFRALEIYYVLELCEGNLKVSGYFIYTVSDSCKQAPNKIVKYKQNFIYLHNLLLQVSRKRYIK